MWHSLSRFIMHFWVSSHQFGFNKTGFLSLKILVKLRHLSKILHFQIWIIQVLFMRHGKRCGGKKTWIKLRVEYLVLPQLCLFSWKYLEMLLGVKMKKKRKSEILFFQKKRLIFFCWKFPLDVQSNYINHFTNIEREIKRSKY